MTMDDQDREFGGTSSTVISDPVDAVLERLNSKSNQTVYETIIEIKNLIIGNNKYKSIYLKEKLVRRLLALINDYYLNHLIGVINQNPSSQQQQQSQQHHHHHHHHHHHQKSPTPPGNTSLGGVVNIDAQLVDVINQILTILSSFALGNLDHCVQLINNYRLHDMLFNLIRLARIYYTELAKASGDCDSASNEESLNGNLKLIESSLRCLSNLYSSAQMAPSLIVALDAHLYVYDVGTKQAVNMESLLKLYQLSRPSSTPSSSSKCRSSHSGLNSGSINLIRQYILNIFSISASNCMYVSRDENLSEARNWRALIIKSDLVRLFAGLLTNLNARVQLACLKFYHAITFECIEAVRVIMTTTYYDCALLDLISAYLSRENSAELQLYAAKCITNLFRSSMAYQQQPQQQREASLEATLSVLTSNHVLIKFKTLPTLIRLASTYSAIYRGHVSSAASSALSYFYTNHLLSCALANSTRPSGGGGGGGQGVSNGTSSDSSNRAKLVKLFGSLVLVDALATLTYLMESCADLQHTAAYLEQIIPALVANVSAGFNSLRFAGGNGVPSTGSLRPIFGRCSLKPSTHINEIKQCVKSWPSQPQSSHHHQHHYYHHHPRTLYSLTYVYYCHFASSAIHGKLNEHQYNFVGSASLGLDAHYQQQHKGNRGKTPALHPLFMRTARFLTSLDSDLLHSRVVAASLQALAALALNSEESRRAIGGDTGTSVGGVGVGTAGSDLVARLIELIEADVTSSSTIDHDDDDDIDDIDDIIETEFDEEMIVGENEGGEGNGDEIQPSTLRRSAHQQRRILADATLLKLSALSLLHSLSRSVHQLRTKFLDIKLTNSVSYLIRRVKMQKDALNEQINSNSKRTSATGKCREPSGDSAAQQLKNEPESEAMQQDQPTQSTAIDTELMISDEASGSGNDGNGPKTDDYNRIDFSTNEQTFISLLLAILANMLIDFSPCKETLINNDIIKTLIEFVDFKNNTSIRVNSMWALMNLAYQSEQKVKQKILSEITIEKLFQLLTEQDETLILKTLGLIRNLICYRSHIDSMMSSYGNKIVQAIVMILEGEYYNYALKEQALCILANIADGSTSKTFIMENEDLLRKINSFMTHTQTELQVAAVYCVLNLVNTNDEGAYERQLKLKEIGAHRILQKLLHSSDPVLFDKVKNALQQFSTNLNNNHNSAASLLASSQSSNT